MTRAYSEKKPIILFLCGIIILGCSFFHSEETNELSVAKSYVRSHIKQLVILLDHSVESVDSCVVYKRQDALRSNYFALRNHYKHIEFFIEYCAPFDVKYFINGPLVKKSEPEIGTRIVEPHGLQVLEEQLFGGDSMDQKIMRNELALLSSAFKTFDERLADLNINDSQLLEMMQFELIRMGSLSLNGADATFTKTNVTECIYVLQSFEDMLVVIKNAYPTNRFPVETQQALILKIRQAKSYCSTHTNYDTFNRLYFITHYIKPIYKLLVRIHRSALFPYTPVNYAIDLKSDKVFERASFNLNYFSVQAIDTIGNALQVELGRFLFFDPVLSGNNQRACASCHKPDMAFSDGLQKGRGFINGNALNRNTPSLLNTVFQKHFFYDGRTRQLEQQANDVLHNQKEMNSSIDEMIAKLNQSTEYKNHFRQAYKGTVDTTISYYGILKAIAEYEKILVSMNSRFDKYIRGDYKQLTAQEINGYTIFAGKALCGSCHFFPLFNSLVPPAYNDTEYEVIGVPENSGSKAIDKDEGRIAVSKSYIHQYAFKSPTLRNIALTAPYMHNGVYKDLDEVIKFYNDGGGQGLGIHIPHQTLPFDSLRLNKSEVADLKAFMLSLTDTAGLTGTPKRLPAFDDKVLNRRVIGGAY
jgi:cytochrome c peroxidase